MSADDHFNSSSTVPKLYVDTDAIKRNFLAVKNAVDPSVEIMPVLKANAYGTGVENVVSVFSDCRMIAVADTSEAYSLKKIMPNKGILILYQPDIHDISSIINNDFIPGVCDLNFLIQLNSAAAAAHKTAAVHISIDSGAGRLGISPDSCRDFARHAASLKNIRVDGLYTHFSCADSLEQSDLDFTNQQIRAFSHGVSEFEDLYGSVKYKHACSSGAIFLHPDAHFNMVRPGYILYGYYPSPEVKKFVKLSPSLKLASKIIYIKDVKAGSSISYGRKFTAHRDSKIATVSIGYSDGLHRSLYKGGAFVVNGQRAPIAGTVCMDMVMLDITDIKGPVSVGDEIFVFDNQTVTLDDIAEQCGTIGYEILSHIEDCVYRYRLAESPVCSRCY